MFDLAYCKEVLASHICVLFTYNGILIHFERSAQETMFGFPLETSSTSLEPTHIYYYDPVFGRCQGSILYVTDLPMSSFVCIDGTPISSLLS